MAITSGIGHFVMAITSGVRNKAYRRTKDDHWATTEGGSHDDDECQPSWKTIYSGETPADQESRSARKEPRGDRRVDRRDRWFPARHLFKVWDRSRTKSGRERMRWAWQTWPSG